MAEPRSRVGVGVEEEAQRSVHHPAALHHRRPLTPPVAPHGMLDERPPALRPGAPAFLWVALHAVGLGELELLKVGDVSVRALLALLYSIAILLGLLAQIGLLVAHWSEVLPAYLATSIFLLVVANWVNLALFVQTGHLHRLLAASAFSVAVLPPPSDNFHELSSVAVLPAPVLPAASAHGARSHLSPACPPASDAAKAHQSSHAQAAQAAPSTRSCSPTAGGRAVAWMPSSPGGRAWMSRGRFSPRSQPRSPHRVRPALRPARPRLHSGLGSFLRFGPSTRSASFVASPPASPPAQRDLSGGALVIDLGESISFEDDSVHGGAACLGQGLAGGGQASDAAAAAGRAPTSSPERHAVGRALAAAAAAAEAGGDDEAAGIGAFEWPAWAVPLGLWPPCRAALWRQVLVHSGLALASAAALGGFEWHWRRQLRHRPEEGGLEAEAARGSALYARNDVVLWALGVEAGGELSAGQRWRWELASTCSCLVVSACFWAPVGCVACVRQLHAHLLDQLRDATLKPLGGVGGPALLLEGSAALAELLGHSSSKLAIFSSSHLILCAYTGMGSAVALADQAWHVPLLGSFVFAVGALLLIIHSYGEINRSFRSGLRRAAASLLRAQLRHGGGGGGGGDAGLLGTCQAVELEARLTPGMLVLGCEVPPNAGVGLILLAASLAIGVGHYVIVAGVFF